MGVSAFAQVCPSGPDMAQTRSELLARLKVSPDQASGMRLANEIWTLWTTAPDQKAQELLDRGMAMRAASDYAGSEHVLNMLVAYCPGYAEGWNQRAFTRFMANRMDASLADIDSALQIEPSHFGALSGRAMILLRQGRTILAQAALRRAVSIHPWLQERAYLVEDAGRDI